MKFESEFIVLFDRLQIRYYGIIIVFAMLIAAWIAARLAKRDGRDPDHIWGALTWAIIPAIILARLWFVLFPPVELIAQGKDAAWFLANFFDTKEGAIAIWSGGLSIFGAFIGGFAGSYLYLRRNKLPVLPWLDIAAVALPLGQAIGRWANFVNQELYGSVTSLPWGITIDATHRVAPYKSLVDYPATTTLFHPLFLYESVWNFLAFIVLLQLFTRYRDRLRYGDIFLLYVMQYSFVRFILEFIRVEVTMVGGINLSQLVTAVAFVIALVVFVIRRREPSIGELQRQAATPA